LQISDLHQIHNKNHLYTKVKELAIKTPADVSYAIRLKAQELGFSKIGIARAVPLDGQFLNRWLSSSCHAGMVWMQRTSELRLDPGKFLPGAASVISVAVNYYSDSGVRSEGSAQVSRYAVGRDYHFVLEEMLIELSDYITYKIPGVSFRNAVDSAPALDKIWAAFSGLGWIGKNSNLITREYGSYVFLGEIFLDCVLEYDSPSANYCGNCTKCIDACPTGAIVEPYIVDSRKCISYRTIEHRGDFPDDWQPGIRDWIFGCDICQEVCPWNKFARETIVQDLKPREGIRYPTLSGIETMTENIFKKKFADSPVKRSKFEGFKRNARHVRNFLDQAG